MHIKNMNIGQRLALSFGCVIALLIALSMLSYSRVDSLKNEIALTANDRYPMTVLANRIIHEINAQARYMRNALLMANQQDVSRELASVNDSGKAAGLAFDDLDKIVVFEKSREFIKTLTVFRQQYLLLKASFIKLVNDGKRDEASAFLLEKMRPIETKYTAELEKFLQFQDSLMAQAGQQSIQQAENAELWITLLAISAGIISVLASILTTRSITRPLNEALKVAQTVAAGNLTSRINVKSTDETGRLMQAMQNMNTSLVKTVGQVRNGTDSIASASGQIAAGNLDLSSRTEEQASTLEQTAASMEELTGTVKQNADNARQADQLAASASEIAIKGGTVVAQVIDTMHAIHASAGKIVDIISVIDGIAFQTNILALNAAVEAARAGEQGRGFAVVASEVRNLAQRSASAAKEIKALIDDSMHKVDTGSTLVVQAGTTMQEIVASVKKVADIMAEITTASQEQSQGIEQVNQAIIQMDDVTQQNAALVEQAAAASEALQEQASNLAQVVSVFQLDGTQALPFAAQVHHFSPKIAQPASGNLVSMQKKQKMIANGTVAPVESWEDF
ncbi:MAG: methyl-accepting chemotaxis protein [Burkholderiaceae bacterium]